MPLEWGVFISVKQAQALIMTAVGLIKATCVTQRPNVRKGTSIR